MAVVGGWGVLGCWIFCPSCHRVAWTFLFSHRPVGEWRLGTFLARDKFFLPLLVVTHVLVFAGFLRLQTPV